MTVYCLTDPVNSQSGVLEFKKVTIKSQKGKLNVLNLAKMQGRDENQVSRRILSAVASVSDS